MKKLLNKKTLLVGLVLAVAFFNTLLAKYIHPTVQIPGSVAEEVAEYVLPDTESENVQLGPYLVTYVVDGDTIDVDINGVLKRVRYIGVDTPENAVEENPAECFAREATEFNRELVEGKYVTLVKDVSEVDKYGRLLRYVYAEDEFVNLSLIKGGYARFVTFPPDVSQASVLLEAERGSKEAGLGLWGSVCSG